jgi:hypothetical protein
MLRFLALVPCLTVWILLATGQAAAKTVVDFETLGSTLAPESAYIGADGAGGFTSQGASFNNVYGIDPTYGPYWIEHGYSNRTQFDSANLYGNNNDTIAAPGTGVDSSPTWAIANTSFANSAVIQAPNGAFFDSMYVTNTATTAFLLEFGNQYATKFGGASGNDQDLFTVRFNDLSPGGSGFVEFILADYRFADPLDDYIVNDWQQVDLTPLNRATRIGVEFTSTDVDPVFGINTPTYLAIDNVTFESLTAVPEPGAMAILTVLGMACAWRRHRKTRAAEAVLL